MVEASCWRSHQPWRGARAPARTGRARTPAPGSRVDGRKRPTMSDERLDGNEKAGDALPGPAAGRIRCVLLGTAADNHPVRHVQHRASKRQRKHHRLEHRRHGQRRQPSMHGPHSRLGAAPGIRFSVRAQGVAARSARQAVSGRFRQGVERWTNSTGWGIKAGDAQSLPFQTSDPRVGITITVRVLIGDDAFMWAQILSGGLSTISVQGNGGMDYDGRRYIGPLVIDHQVLTLGQSTMAVIGDEPYLAISNKRIADSEGDCSFDITLSP